MAKSKKVMQVEHEGQTAWLYDNGQIRNAQGHLLGTGEVPQSYTDGKKALEAVEEVKNVVVQTAEEATKPHVGPPAAKEEVVMRWDDAVKEINKEIDAKVAEVEAEMLPEPPPAPQEIKDPPMNDLQVVLNIGTQTDDGFEVSFTKSKIIGSHNIKVISGQLRHKLTAALERIVLQSNTDLRAIRDAPLVEQFKEEAARDAKKAEQKKELKSLLKGL